MKNFKVEGIVIKRRNFGEADKILTVLTRQNGKIHVKASGIRRIPSRRSAHVELLNLCVLNLYSGRNYPILTEAQTIDNYAALKEDFEAIGKAYHLCELVDSLCPENQENTDVFYLLKKELEGLCRPAVNSTRMIAEKISNESGYSSVSGNNWPMQVNDKLSGKDTLRNFEISLLGMLGFLPESRQSQYLAAEEFDSRSFIENILEKKLKSADVFSRI